jgi:hypothetical protein
MRFTYVTQSGKSINQDTRIDFKAIQDAITQLLLANPELEEDEVLRADSVEGQTGAFEFMSRIIRMIGATQAIIAGTAAYIHELQDRKVRLERREHSLRSLIAKILNTADIRKAELPEATVYIKAGVPAVVIINEHEIPDEFWRVRREPDRTRIRAALKAGEHVPGTALSNAEPFLAISPSIK